MVVKKAGSDKLIQFSQFWETLSVLSIGKYFGGSSVAGPAFNYSIVALSDGQLLGDITRLLNSCSGNLAMYRAFIGTAYGSSLQFAWTSATQNRNYGN